MGQHWDDFPKLKDWVDRIYARPAVARALAKGDDLKRKADAQSTNTAEAAKHLFGQTAASVRDACDKAKQG